MQTTNLPRFIAIIWVAFFLVVTGAGGLVILLYSVEPVLWARWLFFFLFLLTISGLALPPVYLFNRRLEETIPSNGGTILREAVWIGIYGCLLAWLQMGRLLTNGLIVLMGIGFIILEVIFRFIEVSQWKPKE